MKNKLLLLYGYLIPIVASTLLSILPCMFGFIRYDEIFVFVSGKMEIVFAFIAIVVATTFPFQSALINEDNPHVLAVLEKSRIRVVFVRSSVFQAIVIVVLALLIIVLSARSGASQLFGFIQLFSLSLITFESIALISNGRSYSRIRERIITEINKKMRKSSLDR